MSGLAQLPLTLRGGWLTPAPVGGASPGQPQTAKTWRWDWEGVLSGAERLVALTIVVAGGRASWAKSGRHVLLEHGVDTAAELPVALTLGYWGEVGSTIWLNLAGARDGANFRAPLGPPSVPELPAERRLVTGEAALLATIEAQEPLEIGVLALARRDVRFVRKGIWHVRPRLVEALAPPWRHVLTRGRHGWWNQNGGPG